MEREGEMGEYKRISLRLPSPIWERITDVARRNDRTLNSELIRAVRAHIEKEAPGGTI